MHKKFSTVFLFPHQDDELGCFFEIQKENKLGNNVIIFFLTSGTHNGKISYRRNLESTNVLSCLGCKKKKIFFINNNIKSQDGKLIENIEIVHNIIYKKLKKINNLSRLYFPAWEGGHQDHDASHLIGVSLAKKFKIIKNSYQFPLYTGIGLCGSFFKLFNPIYRNGRPIAFNIPWNKRIKYLRLALNYPSQFKSFIGIFPFFLFHYFFFGTQVLQPISIHRVKSRPHQGKLLYERRYNFCYKYFKKLSTDFIKKYIK